MIIIMQRSDGGTSRMSLTRGADSASEIKKWEQLHESAQDDDPLKGVKIVSWKAEEA